MPEKQQQGINAYQDCQPWAPALLRAGEKQRSTNDDDDGNDNVDDDSKQRNWTKRKLQKYISM